MTTAEVVENQTLSLSQVCTMKIDEFKVFGTSVDTIHGPLIFQDNGAKILGVGHLDYVKFAKPGRVKGNPNTIYCPQLDDRLGVYCLLEPLKKYSRMPTFDILLTDSEEKGNSTAQFFKPPRQYNWMFELDRAGSDVVYYGYGMDKWEEILKNNGFSTNRGSFSDISELEHCKCKAANWGVGYHNAHSDACHADLIVTKKNLLAFVEFARKYENTYFPHEPNSDITSHYCMGYGAYTKNKYNKKEKTEKKEWACENCKTSDSNITYTIKNNKYYCDTCSQIIKIEEQEEEKDDNSSIHYYDPDDLRGFHELGTCHACNGTLENGWMHCAWCGKEIFP